LFSDRERAELQVMVDNKYGPYDGGSVNAALMVLESDQEEMLKIINANSKLLGYDVQLAKTQAEKGVGSSDESALAQELAEERFFVVLMAYDYRTMKKDSTPKLLWTTRFSIRATGNLFSTAVPVISKAASPYFGRNLDVLKREDYVPEGKVDLGLPKVIGKAAK
jgi:hypothetical protein